jgi:hypothetical protein
MKMKIVDHIVTTNIPWPLIATPLVILAGWLLAR